MKIAILYNQPGQDAGPDELDILDEVHLIEECLETLNHESFRIPVTLNLSAAANRIRSEKPDLIFNLAETIENHGALVYLVPALLDILDVPYTGTHTEAMFLTAGKHLTKQILRDNNLPVIPTYTVKEINNLPPGRYIIKPKWEEGSLGLDEDAVFTVPGDNIGKFTAFADSKYFIEPYIDGREFNVSMLARENGPEVIAVAEILFRDYPEDKPKVLGYRAKWIENSFEYDNTYRTYDLGDNSEKINRLLGDLSLRSWHAVGLRGYGRVDFRMTSDGLPVILEVNSNPCITPGSGFYAACEYSGLSFHDAVAYIIDEAIKK